MLGGSRQYPVKLELALAKLEADSVTYDCVPQANPHTGTTRYFGPTGT